MGVDVHKAGGDDEAGGVDDACGAAFDPAHRGDAAATDADISAVGGNPSPVDNRPVANQHIILGHNSLLTIVEINRPQELPGICIFS